ncbi:hypothetical protein F4808DRAFT_416598 [Astrocystis sublimbata]|nr:hypothetical protein F4808DRAFT_446449 [Astrocystis sublimbata]KAI0203435.1 hypothetical protein F4808DRAFT_416598 [Astrocystis sublimbata]
MSAFASNMSNLTSRRSSSSSHCSHAKVTPTVEKVDAQSDMMLIVGKEACTDPSCNDAKENRAICFQVNSTVLAGASPRFGLALLSPGAEVVKNSMNWTVKFPNDSPQAMRIMIHILYGYYPSTAADEHMRLELLVQLTMIANKYDLVHKLSTWPARWIRQIEPYWAVRGFTRQPTEDLESFLWIFWVLGHEPLYTYMLLQIAFHSGLDAVGKLTDPAGKLCFTSEVGDVAVPPCALGTSFLVEYRRTPLSHADLWPIYHLVEVTQARIEVLEIITKEVRHTLDGHLCGGHKSSRPQCRRMDSQDDSGWRRNVFASLEGMLQAEGIWPLSTAYALTVSPRRLVELFRANPNIPSFHHHHDGRYCDANGAFWKRIETLLREVRLTLSAASATHLGEQADKSGLASYFESKRPGFSPTKGNWNLLEIQAFQENITKADSGGAEAQ